MGVLHLETVTQLDIARARLDILASLVHTLLKIT